MKMVEVYMCRI